MPDQKKKSWCTPKRIIIISVVALVSLIGLILVIYFVTLPVLVLRYTDKIVFTDKITFVQDFEYPDGDFDFKNKHIVGFSVYEGYNSF